MLKWRRVWRAITLALFVIGLAGVPTNIGRWGIAAAHAAHYLNLGTIRVILATRPPGQSRQTDVFIGLGDF